MARKAQPSRGTGKRATPSAQEPAVGLAPKFLLSFAVQALLALIGVASVPVFLKLLGAEGYGLVGFYAVLQAWMLALELGLSPAVSRQLSRFTAGVVSSQDAFGLVRAAEIVFGAIACAICLVFFVSSHWLRGSWLGPSTLSPDVLRTSLQLLGCLIAVRWVTTFYHAALVGLERQNILNITLLLSAIARTSLSVICLIFISRSPIIFFGSQLLLVPVEAAICRAFVFGKFKTKASSGGPKWRLLRQEVRFASVLALTSTVWMIINQIDKLILSHTLSLRDFGLFSLVVSICSGIALTTPPVVQLLQPRLTLLFAQNRRDDFVRIYRLSTDVVIVLAFGLAGTIAAQPELVLLAWTDDPAIATHLAPVLSLYAAGTGIASYLIVPYLLQYAHGFVRLHLIANLVFGAIWIPVAVVAAYTHGALGTGATWLAGNLLFVTIWVPIVHRRLLAPAERRGLTLGPLLRSGVLVVGLASTRLLSITTATRVEAFAILVALAAAVTVTGVMMSAELRENGLSLLRERQRRHPQVQ